MNAPSTFRPWDLENRLSSVNLPANGGTVSFTYDPFGRRIQKTTASGSTIYVYDGANVVAEYNSAGAVVASYTQGAGVDEPLAMRRGGYVAYYHADGLGSITSMIDGTGKTISSYVYKAFGSTTPTESIFNPFRYTGREQDPETGLYYYRARYYDSQVGRFISEDPAWFEGGLNLYAYVSNSSPNWRDSNGTWPDKWVPRYGNWGGPDWSGGWRPSAHAGRSGPMTPIDSMDILFMAHDNAYAAAAVDAHTANKNCNSIKDSCSREKCNKKAAADLSLYLGLLGLDPDPTKWNYPAPDVNKAKSYRQNAIEYFPWPF